MPPHRAPSTASIVNKPLDIGFRFYPGAGWQLVCSRDLRQGHLLLVCPAARQAELSHLLRALQRNACPAGPNLCSYTSVDGGAQLLALATTAHLARGSPLRLQQAQPARPACAAPIAAGNSPGSNQQALPPLKRGRSGGGGAEGRQVYLTAQQVAELQQAGVRTGWLAMDDMDSSSEEEEEEEETAAAVAAAAATSPGEAGAGRHDGQRRRKVRYVDTLDIKVGGPQSTRGGEERAPPSSSSSSREDDDDDGRNSDDDDGDGGKGGGGKPPLPAGFKWLRRNEITHRPVHRPRASAAEYFNCACAAAGLACEDGACTNRAVFEECCAANCDNGEACTNRRLSKGKFARSRIKQVGAKGWGLVAAQDIPAGTMVAEYVGEVINQEQRDERLAKYSHLGIGHHYIMHLADYKVGAASKGGAGGAGGAGGGGKRFGSEFIDATMKGGPARFVNHSCDPNCAADKWKVAGEYRIAIVARRPVPRGEELTYNYKFEWFSEDQPVPCHCGAANCRGYIGADSARALIGRRLQREAESEGQEANGYMDSFSSTDDEEAEGQATAAAAAGALAAANRRRSTTRPAGGKRSKLLAAAQPEGEAQPPPRAAQAKANGHGRAVTS